MHLSPPAAQVQGDNPAWKQVIVRKKQTWGEKLVQLDEQEAALKEKLERLEKQKSEAFRKFREVLADEDAEKKRKEKLQREAAAAAAAAAEAARADMAPPIMPGGRPVDQGMVGPARGVDMGPRGRSMLIGGGWAQQPPPPPMQHGKRVRSASPERRPMGGDPKRTAAGPGIGVGLDRAMPPRALSAPQQPPHRQFHGGQQLPPPPPQHAQQHHYNWQMQTLPRGVGGGGGGGVGGPYPRPGAMGMNQGFRGGGGGGGGGGVGGVGGGGQYEPPRHCPPGPHRSQYYGDNKR